MNKSDQINQSSQAYESSNLSKEINHSSSNLQDNYSNSLHTQESSEEADRSLDLIDKRTQEILGRD